MANDPPTRSPVADEAKRWQERSLLAAENSLWARPKHDEALKNEEIRHRRPGTSGGRHRLP